MAGIGLSPEGNMQALGLAERLASEGIDLIQSSPQQRSRETAAPIADRLGLPLQIEDAIDEIDVGDWTGRSFASLSIDERWRAWNQQRSSVRPPNGESMPQLQDRVIAHLRATRSTVPHGSVVMVTHAEPIRAAVMHCLSLNLDQFATVTIEPASISTITASGAGISLLSVNQQAAA
jgi:broad specificity phosphatase PhoE